MLRRTCFDINLNPHGWPLQLTSIDQHKALAARQRQAFEWLRERNSAVLNRGRSVMALYRVPGEHLAEPIQISPPRTRLVAIK